MKESWSNTLLNSCTMMNRRWNKTSRLSLVARLLSILSFLPDDLKSHKPTHWAFQQWFAQSESRLSEQYICLSFWQLLVLLLILLLRQLRLHMSRPESRQLWRPRQEIFCSATEPKWPLTDINPAVPLCLVLLQRKERELQVHSKLSVSLICQAPSCKQIHDSQKRPLVSHDGIDGRHIAPYQAAALWQLLRLHRRAASHKKKSAMHAANPRCVVPKLRER